MGNAKAKNELLRGPLMKVERARQHVNDLDRKIGDYLARCPFKLRVRQRTDPPHRLVYVNTEQDVPDDFAMTVGDAAHNLRTALDHICFGMVGDQAPNFERVGFPFAKRKDGLGGAINTRQLQVAPKRVADEFHALQPYPGGNKYLYAVKEIDERDKHHRVLTVGLAAEFTLFQLGYLVGMERVRHLGDLRTKLAAVGDFAVDLSDDPPTEEFDRESDVQPAFTIGFGEGEALVSAPVIPALNAMIIATEEAVHRLARAYFS